MIGAQPSQEAYFSSEKLGSKKMIGVVRTECEVVEAVTVQSSKVNVSKLKTSFLPARVEARIQESMSKTRAVRGAIAMCTQCP